MCWFYVAVAVLFVGISAEDKTVTVGNFTTKVKGQSGKIAVYRNGNESDGVTITFDAIKELDSSETEVNKHSYNNFAQLTFSFSNPENTTYRDTNVTVTQFNFTSTIPLGNGTATLTSYVYIFTSEGNITVDGNDFGVKYGDMKFNAEIENWPFCAGSGSDCKQGQTFYTGQYVDFSVEIKGKKTPESVTDSGIQGEYDLGGGDTVVVPKKVLYDNTTTKDMPTGYPKLETQGSKSVFIFRFEKFNSSALYDPVISLAAQEAPDNGGSTAEESISASGVSVKVLGNSGKIELMNVGSTGDSKNTIVVEFDNLLEKTMDGTDIKDSAHKFNTFASQDFTFGTPVDEMYTGTTIGVRRITFQSNLNNGATLKVHLYVFKAAGNITQENETTQVQAGNVKFNVEIMGWTFCAGACQQSEVGEYLDFDIVIKGKGTTKKQSGETYDLGSGKVMLSKKIKVDGSSDLADMAEGYPMFVTQGSKQVFRFRFPKFNSSVLYDPTVSLYGDNGSGSVKITMATILLAIISLLLQKL